MCVLYICTYTYFYIHMYIICTYTLIHVYAYIIYPYKTYPEAQWSQVSFAHKKHTKCVSSLMKHGHARGLVSRLIDFVFPAKKHPIDVTFDDCWSFDGFCEVYQLLSPIFWWKPSMHLTWQPWVFRTNIVMTFQRCTSHGRIAHWLASMYEKTQKSGVWVDVKDVCSQKKYWTFVYFV